MSVDQAVARQVLERVVQKTGSLNRTARLLGVTPGALEFYFEGRHVMPDSLFIRLVDLAMEESATSASPLQEPLLPGK